MKILIAGGSGFLGSYLKKRFVEHGFSVKIVSRAKGDAHWNEKELINELATTDILINLAGASINCKFTKKNKAKILTSRIETTALLNKAVSICKKRPSLWINASATGIYSHSLDNKYDEYSAHFADDFLGIVVQKWEDEFYKDDFPETRKIALRTSVVLGKSGGVYPLLNRLSKLGVGGKQGDGNQIFSWIYLEDYFRIIMLAIKDETISGALNAVAPIAISNRELMLSFRKINRPVFAIPSPKFLLKIASYILDFQPDLVLDSTNAYSQKLEDLQFIFLAKDIKTALEIIHNEK